MNETTTTNDENLTAIETATAALNASTTHANVYGKHCALVGNGWLFWYPAARPAFGFVAYYVVPMLLIGVLYGRVVYTLLTTTSYYRHGGGERERQQAAKSLIVFVVIVVFCLLPVHVVILLTDYHVVDTNHLYVLVYVSLYAFAVNSVFNAVIVTVISRQYRRQVVALVGLQRCRRRRHRDDTSINWTGSRTQTQRTYDDHGTSSSPFIWHSTRV